MKKADSNINSEKATALYIRVSTEAQRDEGYSIDAQRDMLIGYCTSRRITHWELYIDGGFSGSSIERPEIARMIEDVAQGDIERVVVYKLDRLSRSQKDTLYLIEDVFNPNGCDFISLNENMDTSTPIGRAMLGIMSAFAQLERETIRERTRMGIRERVKSGLWRGGGHVPFGYDYDREQGILIPNGDAETVRRIYELYIGGISTLKIAQIVGLKYERMAAQILRRRTNAGYIAYNGEEYKGLHEAIIPEETYECAMRIMRDRSVRTLVPARSLLAGLIYCGLCGAKMRYQKWGRRGYKIYCYSQDSGKPHLAHDINCTNDKVWADEVEDIVLRDFFKMAKNAAEISAETDCDRDMSEYIRARREITAKKLKNLYNLYASSEDEILLETIRDTKNELSALDEKLDSHKETEESLIRRRQSATELATIENLWDGMTLTEKQSILRGYIEKIVITHDKIDIYYTIT